MSYMPGKQRSFDEWEREQRERDPDWDRYVREFEKIRGPKRKVPLLLDENLEAEFVRDLLTVKDFRVAVGTPATSDDTLWDEARRSKAILVTSDMDFWDDRKFPIAQSPGVIIVQLRPRGGLVGHHQALANTALLARGIKLKSSREGVVGKYWDGGSVISV